MISERKNVFKNIKKGQVTIPKLIREKIADEIASEGISD
jgi:bifunctional DNA-binding transcriptional regulator/antitoxin component of YhaV-PrlF toxin-antitoxin module